MTAVHGGQRSARSRSYVRTSQLQLDWAAIGVIAALLGNAAAGVWFASALNERVKHLEQEIPAGSLVHLDDRLGAIEKRLGAGLAQ